MKRNRWSVQFLTTPMDAHWNNVASVAAGEVYRIPQAPFSWFGRPPSAVRALGCLWLVKMLYPEHAADVDLAEETRAFYRTFYRLELPDERLEAILGPATSA